ncbi:alpha/beta hydrolase [Bifidobacterium amazonense]
MLMQVWSSWLQSLMRVRIVSGPFHDGVLLAAAIGLLALAAWQLVRADRVRLLWQLLAGVVTGAAGLLAAWLISDVIMVFGVSLGWAVIGWAAAGFAALGFVTATAVQARALRRVIAIVMIPVMLVAAAVQVDTVYGEYQTIGSLVGWSPYQSVSQAGIARPTMTVDQWQRLAADGNLPNMPSTGRLFSERIANTASKFRARPAMVWLPPAALSDTPPKLPVLILLAGQPGSPGRAMQASGITALLNAYAATHNGLAPIVVSPDQNGGDTINSLCADTTKFGKAETYLTKDVPNWIAANLPADDAGAKWAISGFSQGGTCSTQLAPRHADLFGTMIAVDGEIAPTSGSVDNMVASYFGGDRSAYESQVPVNALAAHAPSDQAAVLAAGENDTVSVDNVRTIGAAARKAGWDVTELEVPGTGHDWHAVNATLTAALPWWCARVGLGGDGTTDHKTWNDYRNLEVLR